jgi:dCMP deaminase
MANLMLELCTGLSLAQALANMRSKDPNTKVGACVYDQRTRAFHLGYNGFPPGVADSKERWDDRPTKYLFVRHAEENAILKALIAGSRIEDCSLVVTLNPCVRCTGFICNVGIKHVYYKEYRQYDEQDVINAMMAESFVSCEPLTGCA